MNGDINYITQLTKTDIKEIASVANLAVGDGLYINKNSGSYVIFIDKIQFKTWVKKIIDGEDI